MGPLLRAQRWEPRSILPARGAYMKPRPFIAVVDDDESVRESLFDLLRELGYEARGIASAEEFLDSGCLAEADCLLLDGSMPGMSGPELHRDLLRRGERAPVIFITAQRDRRVRAALCAKGAVEVVFKPYS